MPDLPDFDHLKRLTILELRQKWFDLGLRGDPPRVKHLLVHGIAWHLQAQARGGLDAETRRLLRAAIRNAPEDGAITGKPRRTRSRKQPKRTNATPLQSGSTLIRTWRGRKHTVTVLDGGNRFRYANQEYASLSEVGRAITGARWSGPRFFGLTKVRAVS